MEALRVLKTRFEVSAGQPLHELYPDDAARHSRSYSFDAIRIFEGLLLIWKDFSGRKGFPYPTMDEISRFAAEKKLEDYSEILRLVYRFFRDYALFSMGNMGWIRKVWKGYESLGSSNEFCWMLRERQVTMKWLSEGYTSIVNIYLFIFTQCCNRCVREAAENSAVFNSADGFLNPEQTL